MTMQSILRVLSMPQLRTAHHFTVFALLVCAATGFAATGTFIGLLQGVLIGAVLGVLELSLSFDNAIVNAAVLEDMDEKWQHRFLTWGIWIAVFGMRIIFPLAIVGIAAGIGPIDALVLAVAEPEKYESIMHGAHAGIVGFGATFLAMVGFKHFFDSEKDEHWIEVIEARLAKIANLESIEIAIILLILYAISSALPAHDSQTFLISGIFGLITFIIVKAIGNRMEQINEERRQHHVADAALGAVAKAGFAGFLYLEILDASFSFDGVIGAFALSNNLFIIAAGLGIGAVYIRSMTLMLVEHQSLSTYRHLENGAFWAILALAAMMYGDLLVHIPEVVTGLVGAAFIGLAFWHSQILNKREDAAKQALSQDESGGLTSTTEPAEPAEVA